MEQPSEVEANRQADDGAEKEEEDHFLRIRRVPGEKAVKVNTEPILGKLRGTTGKTRKR
jgi:hypothetical protein